MVSEQILNDVLPRGSEDERVIQNRNENIEDFYKRSSNDMFIFLFYVTLIKRQRLFVYSRHLFTCGRGGWNSVFLWSTTRTSLDLNVDGVVRVHLFLQLFTFLLFFFFFILHLFLHETSVSLHFAYKFWGNIIFIIILMVIIMLMIVILMMIVIHMIIITVMVLAEFEFEFVDGLMVIVLLRARRDSGTSRAFL